MPQGGPLPGVRVPRAGEERVLDGALDSAVSAWEEARKDGIRQHCSGLSTGEHSLLGFALTHMSFNNTARLSNNPGALKKSERPIRPLAPERSLLPSGSQTLMRPLGLPLAEGLTKQKGILSRFWGLEARAPGAIARAGSF